MYWFPRTVKTKYNKLVDKREIYSLAVVEARSPKSRCWQSQVLSESSGRGLLFASSYILVAPFNPWHPLAHRCISQVSSPIVTCFFPLECISLCVLTSYFYTVLPYLNCTCKVSIPQYKYIHRNLGIEHILLDVELENNSLFNLLNILNET